MAAPSAVLVEGDAAIRMKEVWKLIEPDEEKAVRAELLGKLTAAQSELASNLAELRRSGRKDAELISESESQLETLVSLQQRLIGAVTGPLAGLRKEIVTSVAAAQAVGQQTKIALSMNTTAESTHLATVSAATRHEVATLSTDLFERRIFDKHLVFSSTEEEEAYRRREAEGRRYIEAQLASRTPSGDLTLPAWATVPNSCDAGTVW